MNKIEVRSQNLENRSDNVIYIVWHLVCKFITKYEIRYTRYDIRVKEGRRIVIMKKKEEARDNKTEKDEEIREKKTQKKEKEGIKEKVKEEEKKQEEGFGEPDLPVLFVWFISMLNGKAWEYLGLIMNPETKEINKDLKKAKIAIDTVAFLFDQIRGDLKPEDFKRIENSLANLRMNYVEKLKES